MKQRADTQKNKKGKGKRTYEQQETEEEAALDGEIIGGDKKNGKDDVEKRNQAIDEVQALEGIFYTFFGN